MRKICFSCKNQGPENRGLFLEVSQSRINRRRQVGPFRSVVLLADQKWSGRMNKHDYRALTPLIYNHVTPYGAFDLDMSKRLLPDPIPDGLKLAA